MIPLDADSFSKIANVGLAGLVMIASLRRWIVWGWQYDAMEKDRNFYRDLHEDDVSVMKALVSRAEVRRL